MASKKMVLVVAALLLVALALEAAPPAAAMDCKAGCAELSRLGVFNCEKRCEAIAAQAQQGPRDPDKSVLF